MKFMKPVMIQGHIVRKKVYKKKSFLVLTKQNISVMHEIWIKNEQIVVNLNFSKPIYNQSTLKTVKINVKLHNNNKYRSLYNCGMALIPKIIIMYTTIVEMEFINKISFTNFDSSSLLSLSFATSLEA